MTETSTCLLIDMETASVDVDDEADQHVLTDSGTESFNESPVTDEENSGSESKRSSKNILDKKLSVDEDKLIKPLEPVVCSYPCVNNNVPKSDEVSEDFEEFMCLEDQEVIEGESSMDNGTEKPLVSILRGTSCIEADGEEERIGTPRRVSFPANLAILASYKEPDLKSPFHLTDTLSAEEILAAYQSSCTKHNTIVLDVIKNQILDIKSNINFMSTLNLASVNVTMEVCETLEDLFKIVNFRSIILKECKFTTECLREFINVLEYYNCASEFIISDQFRELDAWKTFCNMLSKCSSLESLVFDGVNFGESHIYIKSLLPNINLNGSIVTLKFNNCNMGNAQDQLFDSLSKNDSIQELYLPQTGLYKKEADALGKLLTRNFSLKVLDISNNLIGDRGLEALAKGLCSQKIEGCGISVLVIFNNQITEKSGTIISNIIAECKTLHTLNIGYNNLTDDVVTKIANSLAETKSLEGLGLQNTLLTDKGISELAEVIQQNTSLQKINIKGNKAIQVASLEKLSKALTNTKITKVEIDDTNRNCDDPQGFLELVKQINALCTVNKSKPDELVDEEMSSWSLTFSRKVSLNCEPVYCQPLLPEPLINVRKKSPSPSPIPSPGCSPMPRSRFSVSRVPDPVQAKPKSRFKVYAVTMDPVGGGDACSVSPPPSDDLSNGKFSNVRSSVSSIDSVDSVSTNRDSVYDSATPSCESD